MSWMIVFKCISKCGITGKVCYSIYQTFKGFFFFSSNLEMFEMKQCVFCGIYELS